jgi:hypothetical protein
MTLNTPRPLLDDRLAPHKLANAHRLLLPAWSFSLPDFGEFAKGFHLLSRMLEHPAICPSPRRGGAGGGVKNHPPSGQAESALGALSPATHDVNLAAAKVNQQTLPP